tara:strand:+ start:7753 stop:9069 length:1317 start_codon:yes stop_codon:yes gene_type:complete
MRGFDYSSLVADPSQAVNAGLGAYQTMSNVQNNKIKLGQNQQMLEQQEQQNQFNQELKREQVEIQKAEYLLKDAKAQAIIRKETESVDQGIQNVITSQLLQTDPEQVQGTIDSLKNKYIKEGNNSVVDMLTKFEEVPKEQQHNVLQASWFSHLSDGEQVKVVNGLKTNAKFSIYNNAKEDAIKKGLTPGTSEFNSSVENYQSEYAAKSQGSRGESTSSKTFQQKIAEGTVKEIETFDADVIKSVEDTQRSKQMLESLPNMFTGKFADIKTQIGEITSALGIEMLEGATSATQIFDKDQRTMAISKMKETGETRFTDADLVFATKQVVNNSNTPQATENLLRLGLSRSLIPQIIESQVKDLPRTEQGYKDKSKDIKKLRAKFNNVNMVKKSSTGNNVFFNSFYEKTQTPEWQGWFEGKYGSKPTLDDTLEFWKDAKIED